MPWPKKVHTREMLTKNSLGLKIPLFHNFPYRAVGEWLQASSGHGWS